MNTDVVEITHMLARWLPSPAHEILIALAAIWLYVEVADWIRWGRGAR